MSLLPLALQLPLVNTPHLVDRRDLIDRLVVADVGDAREAKRVAGLVARRLLDPVERDLEDDRRLDDDAPAVPRGRRAPGSAPSASRSRRR